MFAAMGAEAFADRARRELLAAGESAQKHAPTPATSSPHKKPKLRGWPETVSRTPKSEPGCS
jgi:hypothetical protein